MPETIAVPLQLQSAYDEQYTESLKELRLVAPCRPSPRQPGGASIATTPTACSARPAKGKHGSFD